MKYLSPVLSPAEEQEFDECDQIIQETKAAIPALLKWGDALRRIKAGSLWRGSYKSFEDYVDQRTGYSIQHANRLLSAAVFREEQAKRQEHGEAVVVPETERQARELMKESQNPTTPADLPPPPTIRNNTDSIRTNTDKVSEPGVHNTCVSKNKDNSSRPPKELPKQYSDAKGFDKMGYPIPEKAWVNFDTRGDLQKLVFALGGVKAGIEQMEQDKRPGYVWLNKQDLMDRLTTMMYELRNCSPVVVCLSCQGRNFEKCRDCRGTGVIPMFNFENGVAKELKHFRQIAIDQLNK